jgi:hypothetical protein
VQTGVLETVHDIVSVAIEPVRAINRGSYLAANFAGTRVEILRPGHSMPVRVDTASTSYCLLNGESWKIMQISLPIAINQLNQYFHRFAQVCVSIFRKRP